MCVLWLTQQEHLSKQLIAFLVLSINHNTCITIKYQHLQHIYWEQILLQNVFCFAYTILLTLKNQYIHIIDTYRPACPALLHLVKFEIVEFRAERPDRR